MSQMHGRRWPRPVILAFAAVQWGNFFLWRIWMFRVRHAHDFSSPLRFQVSGIPAELTAEDVHDQLQAGLATRHVTLNESFTFVPARATLRPFVE